MCYYSLNEKNDKIGNTASWQIFYKGLNHEVLIESQEYPDMTLLTCGDYPYLNYKKFIFKNNYCDR